jgi:hypothetical protein
MLLMKSSAIRTKVITLAGRRTDNFWELGNALLMLRDGTQVTGDFKKTVNVSANNLFSAPSMRTIAHPLGSVKATAARQHANPTRFPRGEPRRGKGPPLCQCGRASMLVDLP